MIGLIFMMSLSGTVLSTNILFGFPTPTEPHQITKFFTIQYVTSTVALSSQTVTETVNPTCTITATSIPVCGEASVGIIFTSGGSLPMRQDVTTTESDPITTSTATIPTVENGRTDDEETTTFWSVKVDEDDMKDEETSTSWSAKVNNDMNDDETTTPWSVKVDKDNMVEEGDDSTTTSAPLSRLDLSESEIDQSDYNEVDTTTIIYDAEEEISNDIPNDRVSSGSNSDESSQNKEEISSVTTIDNTNDIEIMSILNELSPHTSTVPLENIQISVPATADQLNANTRTNVESSTAFIPLATSVQPNLPLSTSYEMATVVLPSCDCASNRQPRNEDMADIITFMTTRTVDIPTVTVTGTTMHTIQYAGCLPEDAIVTTSCV